MDQNGRKRLDSWKEIANHIRKTERTAIRWEHERGLPVHRVPGEIRSGVYAFEDEIDQWIAGTESDSSALETNRPSTPKAVPKDAFSTAPDNNSLSDRERRRGQKTFIPWGLGVVALGTLVCSLLIAGHPRIRFTSLAQVTHDGIPKSGLVTDGRQLYFSEWIDGRYELSSMPVSGGAMQPISTRKMSAFPLGLSSDGSKLLIMEGQEGDFENALWIVPTTGGMPQRVGNVFCQGAAWRPLSNEIAYAAGHNIFIYLPNGTTPRQVFTATGTPYDLRWTVDGQELRFVVRDVTSGQFELWSLNFLHNASMPTATKLDLHDGQCAASLSEPDKSGQFFFVACNTSETREDTIEIMQRGLDKLGGSLRSAPFAGPIGHLASLTWNQETPRLFSLIEQAAVVDLWEIGPSAQEIRPFWPGIQATELDYSRDGRWVSYISPESKSLWISRSDSSERRQIEFPAIRFEHPHWSKDGRYIAFMAQIKDRPWRIYVVPTSGGIPREASLGTSNQGAPTWSPDGRRLVYGNVKCQDIDSCSLHFIDLATGKESDVPESNGMTTARWSPDGRMIAALFPARKEVHLYNLARKHWQRVAENVSGNDLCWSSDSRYLYASNPVGERPSIMRISVSAPQSISNVDLSSFRKMPQRIFSWFTLTPDRHIIMSRWTHANEIYAFNFDR